MKPYLFKHESELITADDLQAALHRQHADDCDVLYIHSGMHFGMPNLALGRSVLLDSIADILYKLGVSTLLMPSYTFSFCNGEIFNRERSPSSMGALNEHMRLKHSWLRSRDPLMSNILHGKELGLLSKIGKNSVGEGSTFDLLACSGLKVKFLFFGPRIHDCFTYMHYLEAIKSVPYRFNFDFSGTIVDGELTWVDKYTLYIRDDGVKAGAGAKIYENMMIESGIASFERFGGGAITVVDLDAAQSLYLELLDMSPNFYIDEVFEKKIQPKSFLLRKMIAL